MATARVSRAPWLKTPIVELNSGLVAIIGARGSGKTALADMIATGANAQTAGQREASFLNRASSPVNHLGDAEVDLIWGDRENTGAVLQPQPFWDGQEDVRYLSQHFVERLCASSGIATELRQAMERVVFETTNPTDRLEADGFEELAERLLEPVRMRYWDLQRQIDTIADAIVQEDIQVERLPQWKVERTNLAKKIEGAQAELAKLIPKGNEERAKALAALEALCAGAQATVESLRRREKRVQDLAAALTHLEETTEPTRFAAMKQQFSNAELLDGEWDALRMRFAGDRKAAIASAAERAAAAVKRATEEDPGIKIDHCCPN